MQKRQKQQPRQQPPKGPTSEFPMRLNKYLAKSGIASRRDADDIIKSGKVQVNGKKVTEMGFKVQKSDKVKYQGKPIRPENFVYVLLNKPKDFITTMDDPQNRKTVMKLVATAAKERIYPVGRLDRNTTGLLLFTNDGALAEKLTHPSYNIKKIYQVDLDKAISKADYVSIEEGLKLEDGPVRVDDLALLDKERRSLGVEIHIGRNRIVRRIFEHLGYDVKRLDRTMYGPLTKKDLPRGKWRYLTDKEVIMLKNLK